MSLLAFHMRSFVFLAAFVVSVAVSSWCRADAPVAATQPASVQAFLDEPDLPTCIAIIRRWEGTAGQEKIQVLNGLLDELCGQQKLVLVNLTDYFIVPRPDANRFHGHGVVVWQDIFVRGGKAAWAIERLLAIHLPPIKENMAKADLDNIVREVKNCIDAYTRGFEDAGETKP